MDFAYSSKPLNKLKKLQFETGKQHNSIMKLKLILRAQLGFHTSVDECAI